MSEKVVEDWRKMKLNVSKTRSELAAIGMLFQSNSHINGVMKGSASPLPRANSRSIRLFILSGLSDFEDERKVFWQDVLPDLQQHCIQEGAELSVIDPYQGSKVELASQPLLLKALLDEMEEAKSQPSSTFFLVSFLYISMMRL